MTTVDTSAQLRLGADGTVSVEPSIRLNGDTDIHCFSYAPRAPVLVVIAGNVRLSLTVPDVEHVTDEDVKWGRALAEAVGRYVAELEQLASLSKSAAAEGRAA